MPARATTLTERSDSASQQSVSQKPYHRLAYDKAAPYDPSSDMNSSSDQQDDFILSPSSTMIDAEDSSATSAGVNLTTGLDANSDDSHLLDRCLGTPKVRPFFESSGTNQTRNKATVSCRDYLHVPVSKARPCPSHTTGDSWTSGPRLSEPKAQTALAVQTSGAYQKADYSLGPATESVVFPPVSPIDYGDRSSSPTDSLKGDSRPGVNQQSHTSDGAAHLVKSKTSDASSTAKGSESRTVELMSDFAQSQRQRTPIHQRTAPKECDHDSDAETVVGARQERPRLDSRTLPRCEHGGPASHKPNKYPIHDTSAPTALYSPIPVSKVRPSLDPLESIHKHRNHGHSSVPKMRPAHGISSPKPPLAQQAGPVNRGEPKPAPFPASSSVSDSNQASRSLFDHRRTKKWLKDVLKYPENYAPQYTKRPSSHYEGISNTSPDVQDGQLESAPIPPLPSKLHAMATVSSEKPSGGFDRIGFKRAVSDLERLLGEALSIASQVVDQPTSTVSQEPYKQPSISLHSHCRSMHSQNGTTRGSLLLPCSASADGSGGDYWETGVNTPPSKPRSLLSQMKMRKLSQSTPKKPFEEDVSSTGNGAGVRNLEIPRRKSSMKLGKLPLEHQTIADTQAHSQTQPAASDALSDVPVVGQRESQPYRTHNHQLRHTGRRVDRSDYGGPRPGVPEEAEILPPKRKAAVRPPHVDHGISLRRRSHVSLRGAHGFNLEKSHKRQPVARDWSPSRKRFVASVACISTALIGIILGIYSGLVPSIQYYVIDQSHVIIHGNTACFLGLAIPTFFLWPLPLLHGRKPYILSSLVLAMPLLFPQALAVNSQRLTNAVPWRVFLLAARALMGVSLGFASMNFHSILTDLFGASLMSCNPHQEVVDRYDARRHGGGMGVWLGIWTWCWIGSLGLGFLMGACIIDRYNPAWGFYVSIIVIAVVLMLNVVCPEVRRSPFRRSVAEVRTGEDISRRIARGEVMMHRVKTGPRWWGQEVYHGIALNLEMLRQPGFAIMAIYSAWIYAQVVLIIILLGSLLSRFYRHRSTDVGLFVGVVALGALLAIPFQKANVFSRSRQAQLSSNLATLDRKVAWSSHFVRRTVFTLLLPLAGICYAAVSSGPSIHVSVPTIFAGFVGFLSCLAISECNGLVMEAFDCSDLSPAMTGRQKDGSGKTYKRTNYSSFPRVTAGFAAIHSLAFIFAAAATALGGHVTRTLGQRVSTGVVAGILLVLTFLLSLILIRFTEFQIVPKSKSEEMDKLVEARRRSTTRRVSMPENVEALIEEEKAWRPAMIRNPTSRKRRMNIFELGGMTRWQEIRKKNKLIDAGAHLNREAWDQGIGALNDQLSDFRRDAHSSHGKRMGHRKQRGTGDSSERGEPIEMRDLEREQRRVGQSSWRSKRECAMSRSSA
ncbi:hypothetical protein E4U13_007253 [Claviceps humidiphila]|uniref:Polyamine transport protein n=1 Tax=Claviceps humidiphila TaxID=1294629 RepID=A0A9P7U1W5_9HYPO|nr:hypothetical protein E4U13_007253 [Claviceps humidiphila]